MYRSNCRGIRHIIASNPKAKQHAAKADAFLSNGKLEEARIQLISACQHDPGNDELKERLDILYEGNRPTNTVVTS